MGTSQVKTCDRRGRLYLQDTIRAAYGTRFVLVEAPGELILIPVPNDPIADLADLGKALRDVSIEELKREIRETAEDEVGA